MGSKASKGKKARNFLPFIYPISSEKRLENLQHDQDPKNQVIFNVGGTIFETSLITIRASKYDSYFKNITKTYKEGEEIFLDRSPDNFETVLFILRSSVLIPLFKKDDDYDILKHIKKTIKDKDIIRQDLKFFFKKDYKEVIKDYDLSSILEQRDCVESIEKYELIGPNTEPRLGYMFYLAKDIKELYHIYSQKGFFLAADGALLLELSSSKLIRKIEVRPFIFGVTFQNEQNCKMLKVEAKSLSDEWREIGKLNLAFLDEDSLSTLSLPGVHCKHIRISSNEMNECFAISYLKIY